MKKLFIAMAVLLMTGCSQASWNTDMPTEESGDPVEKVKIIPYDYSEGVVRFPNARSGESGADLQVFCDLDIAWLFVINADPRTSMIGQGYPFTHFSARIDGSKRILQGRKERALEDDWYFHISFQGADYRRIERALRDGSTLEIVVPYLRGPTSIFKWSLDGGAEVLADACGQRG